MVPGFRRAATHLGRPFRRRTRVLRRAHFPI